MAKQMKPLPARKPQGRDDSLLIRSAESLGRIIGALQRQLETASRRPASIADDARPMPLTGRKKASGKRTKKTTRMAGNGARKTPKKNVRKVSARKTQRTR